MIVPVQHASLSDNYPFSPLCTFMSQNVHLKTLYIFIYIYISVSKNTSLVCTLLFVVVMAMSHVAGINLLLKAQNLIHRKKKKANMQFSKQLRFAQIVHT